MIEISTLLAIFSISAQDVALLREASHFSERRTSRDLGRIVVSEKQGMCHFSSEVIGDPQDPVTKKRIEILEPITKSMIAEIEKSTQSKMKDTDSHHFQQNIMSNYHKIPSKILPCLKCNQIVVQLIFAENADNQALMEDFYRLMFPKIKEMNVETWIVGKEQIIRHQNIITYVMKVWPQKDEIAYKISFDEFNQKIKKLQNGHCLN